MEYSKTKNIFLDAKRVKSRAFKSRDRNIFLEAARQKGREEGRFKIRTQSITFISSQIVNFIMDDKSGNERLNEANGMQIVGRGPGLGNHEAKNAGKK